MRASRALIAALIGAATATVVTTAPGAEAQAPPALGFELVGHYDTGLADIDEEITAAEIVAYEAGRVYVINTSSATVDMLTLGADGSLTLAKRVDLSAFGPTTNSVAVKNGAVAVAIDGPVKTDPGVVVLLDRNLEVLDSRTVGAIPDMVTFTPDGKTLLVANEGEPNDDYDIDPVGSVSVIGVKPPTQILGTTLGGSFLTVRTAGFGTVAIPAGVRIYGPGASAAQDIEPEYISVAPDGKTALVSLQENNAIAELDIANARITQVVPLGVKDNSIGSNSFDASDKDGAVALQLYPTVMLYEPDGIATFTAMGQQYVVTANEGDTRDYDGFSEETRLKNATLDSTVFPLNVRNAAKNDALLGRLTVSTTGDTDHDGDLDQIQVPGARSISVRRIDRTGVTKADPLGTLSLPITFDSANQLELFSAGVVTGHFNSDNAANNFDDRSDNKGPEPEGVTVGTIGGRTYAFTSIERVGGFVVYDVTNPNAPTYAGWFLNRDLTTAVVGPDSGPEGITFVSASTNPTGRDLILLGNEVTGTVAAWAATTGTP